VHEVVDDRWLRAGCGLAAQQGEQGPGRDVGIWPVRQALLQLLRDSHDDDPAEPGSGTLGSS